MEKLSKQKLKEIEKQEWEELYYYVRDNFFKVGNNVPLDRCVILSLKGLERGQIVANNHQKITGHYGYKVVLYAFKKNKDKILNVIKTINFKSNQSKIAYISKMVIDDLEPIYIKLNNREQHEQETKEIITKTKTVVSNDNYKKKTVEKKNSKFDDLW